MYLSPGEPGCGDSRRDQAEPGKRLPFMFRRSSEDDLHPDGEGLLQTLSQVQTRPGSAAESGWDGGRAGEERL